MKLLLELNNIWDDLVEKYFGDSISGCTECSSTAPPQRSRKVSISSLSKQFNDIFSVEHFYLDSVCLMQCMDLATRYSSVFLVPSAKMDDAVFGFGIYWISHY